MTGPTQIVFILDALAPVKKDEYSHLIPAHQGGRLPLILSERLARKPSEIGPPFDWTAIGRAIEGAVKAAREANENAGDAGVAVYVAGRAPLPLFVHLGQALNFFPEPRVVLNPRRGGPWEAYPMSGATRADERPFFDVIEGLDRPQIAGGRVAVFISTVGAPAHLHAITRLLSDRSETIAGLVEIRTSGAGDVTPDHMPQIALELRSVLSRAPGHFLNAHGFALFVAGPTPLAFAVGLALNPNIFHDVWLMNYAAPSYEYTYTLPFEGGGAPVVPAADADKLARREVLDAIIEGIEDLRGSLKPDDFPPSASDGARRKWIQYLRDLKISLEPEGDAFGLELLHRRLSLGKGLLQALRGREPDMQRAFGQMLLLHELFHDGQELRTSNYYEVGRAGIVLEEVDFAADAFALSALIAWDIRCGGSRAAGKAASIATRWVEWAIGGMEAFDRFEQPGDRIERLYERRLRRYLIWYLQRARARTIRRPADVYTAFTPRLTVELAPLSGRLDPRFDKLVTGPTPHTELFAALDGHLVREARRPGFDPGGLVEAVRSYQEAPVGKAMQYLVEEHQRVLAPWAADDAV